MCHVNGGTTPRSTRPALAGAYAQGLLDAVVSPHFLRGSLAGLLLVSSTLCWACLLFGMTLVKLLLPFAAAQRLCSKIMSLIAEGWIACNKGWMNLVQRTRWNVQGLEGLEYHPTWSPATTRAGSTSSSCNTS